MSLPKSPLTSHADLFALWESVVGDPGFEERALWFAFLDDDNRPLDLVVPVTGLPVQVDLERTEQLLRIVRREITDETVVAMLARPGSSRITESDRDWAQALRSLLAAEGSHWPVHLATDEGLRVLAPDDLIHSRSA